jgi:hypothetical protein
LQSNVVNPIAIGIGRMVVTILIHVVPVIADVTNEIGKTGDMTTIQASSFQSFDPGSDTQ